MGLWPAGGVRWARASCALGDLLGRTPGRGRRGVGEARRCGAGTSGRDVGVGRGRTWRGSGAGWGGLRPRRGGAGRALRGAQGRRLTDTGAAPALDRLSPPKFYRRRSSAEGRLGRPFSLWRRRRRRPGAGEDRPPPPPVASAGILKCGLVDLFFGDYKWKQEGRRWKDAATRTS